MKTSLRENSSFKTILAGRKTVNIANTCLIACLVIPLHGSSTLTHPGNSHAAFPLPHSRGHRQIWSLEFRYGFRYPCCDYTVNVNYCTCWIRNQHSLVHIARKVMTNTQVLLRLHRPNGRRKSELPEENFRRLNKVNNGDIIDPKKSVT
jgi:hypothetical protein